MAEHRRNITPDVMEEETAERKPNFTAFDAKNYLNTKLKDGENEKTLRIRILPVDKDTNSPFKKVIMHYVKVQPELAQNGSKGYVCLHNQDDIDHDVFGDKCPFCEMNQLAYKNMVEAQKKLEKAKKEGDEEEEELQAKEVERWKKISLANKTTEYCVIRCIDRANEEDGPKFWKFTVRSDGKDPKNLIKKLWKARKQESIDDALEEYDVKNVEDLPEDFEPMNILDLETGRDLKVTVSRVFDKDGKPTKKTSTTIVDYGKERPLSKDAEQAENWINDSKVWSDVFIVKPYEYLSIILDGEVPFWDKQNSKWVSKGRARDEEVKKKVREENEANEKYRKAKEKALDYDDEEEEEDDEDTSENLPY